MLKRIEGRISRLELPLALPLLLVCSGGPEVVAERVRVMVLLEVEPAGTAAFSGIIGSVVVVGSVRETRTGGSAESVDRRVADGRVGGLVELRGWKLGSTRVSRFGFGRDDEDEGGVD